MKSYTCKEKLAIGIPDSPAHKPVELEEGDILLFDKESGMALIRGSEYHLPRLSSAIVAGWLVEGEST